MTSEHAKPPRKTAGIRAVLLVMVLGGALAAGFWAKSAFFADEEARLEQMPPPELLAESQRKPASEPVQFVVGRRLLIEKRYADSYQAFQAALAGNPLSVRARAGMASAAGHLGDLDTADRLFNELRHATQESADVEFFRGLLLHYLGDANASLNHLQRAVQLNPQVADFWYALSLSLGERGRKSEARDAVQKASDLSPGRVDFAVAAAELTVLSGDRDKGLRKLEEAAKRWRDQPLPKLTLARVLLKPDSASQSDLRRAETLLREALVIAPDWAEARTELARLQLRSGQPRGALETLELLPKEERELGDTGYLYSQALFRNGMKPEGERVSRNYQKYFKMRMRARDLEAKCEQEPDNAIAHLEAGRALAALRFFPAAMRHYRVTLRLQPDNEVARKEFESLKSRLLGLTEARP